jgi:geranylgeranyl pyrophosphate synthase
MLRAQLVFAAATAVGGDAEDVVLAGEAIELLHGASLVHDDIMDDAALRRGLPSLHVRLGVGQAIVIGDDLLLRAFAVLAEARASHPAARVLEASVALNALARDCCRGQFDELRADQWISEDCYLAIVRRKTAAPFIAAGVLGVLLGGGTHAHVEHIRSYASELGIAFQIGDDLLDLVGHVAAIGKPTGNSLAQGRPMLPLLYLRATAQADLTWLNETNWPHPELPRLLEEHGVLDRVRHTQRECIDRALAALDAFPNETGVRGLRELTRHALDVPGIR